MKVEIWSDIVCPWCAIGEARFEAALAGFAHRDRVEVRWRSFELDPAAPPVSHENLVERLGRKYGLSPEEAAKKVQQIADLAAREGLVIKADRVLANTRDAHRLLHLAADRGCQDALAKRLFAAHFAEKEVVSDHDTLVQLAATCGVDRDEARRVLESEAYAAEVAADVAEAHALGVNGVPFFLIDSRHVIHGAQSTEVFMQTLQRAWAEHIPAPGPADANTCGPDGCAV
ncbi:MAG: DsbA family oxidoreductase [Dehalococcoidia bacterium]|nr:DsbA family oxidoreductase [Dehalococcoidia bacterium]